MLNFTLNWAVEKDIFIPQPSLTLRSGLKAQGRPYPRLPSWESLPRFGGGLGVG